MTQTDVIIGVLCKVCSLLNNECIITGSCADFFHIGYTDIDDIDVIIDSKHFTEQFLVDNKISLLKKLKSKKDGHLLYRCLFHFTKIDILVKDSNLIEPHITYIEYMNNKYKIFSKECRYNQLKNHNYKQQSTTNIDIKIQKVYKRITMYEAIL